MAPRRVAITGVPQAIASATESPKGSSNAIRCSSARAEPRSRARSAPPTGPSQRTARPSTCGATWAAWKPASWMIPAITSGTPAERAAAIARSGPFSGCERPKNSSGASGPGSA